MEEIDLVLVKDDTVSRTFVATFTNGDPQPLTGYTVKMIVYRDTEVELSGTIGGTSNNEVTIEFGNTINELVGTYEYELVATPVSGNAILLGRGNLTFTANTGFTTQIQTIIEKEAKGIFLDQDWITQNIIYWKLWLQDSFAITDALLHDDSSWPPLARFLIAKLVVHDYIAHLMEVTISGNFSSTDGTTVSAGSGAMKSLQTGPSKVEWYDSADSINNLTSKGANGMSAFDQMSMGICSLAGKLGVYLPMCEMPNIIVLPERQSIRRCYPPMVTILTCTYCHEPDRG